MILEDFYAEVLHKLGALAAEEAPSASDRLAAKEKYEQVHAELSRREIGVSTFFDDEDVPDWISDAMAAVVAERLTNKYSVSPAKKVELMQEAREGMTTIISDGQRRDTDPLEQEYY